MIQLFAVVVSPLKVHYLALDPAYYTTTTVLQLFGSFWSRKKKMKKEEKTRSIDIDEAISLMRVPTYGKSLRGLAYVKYARSAHRKKLN